MLDHDHLIGIGTGMMAVSRTFAWWSTCTYAPYVLAPNARAVHLLHARGVTITPSPEQPDPQLSNCISTWFRARHATTTKKKCGAERRKPVHPEPK